MTTSIAADEMRHRVIECLAPALFQRNIELGIVLAYCHQQALRPVRIKRWRHGRATAATVRTRHLFHGALGQRAAARMRDGRADAASQCDVLLAEVGVLEQLRDIRMAGHEYLVEAGDEFPVLQAAAITRLQIIEGVAHACLDHGRESSEALAR